MNIEEIHIANLKCSGCAATISNELLDIQGVTNVEIDVEKSIVTVSYRDVIRDEIIHKLHSLGYPEATEKNGLLMQAKSYASCLVGKLTTP